MNFPIEISKLILQLKFSNEFFRCSSKPRQSRICGGSGSGARKSTWSEGIETELDPSSAYARSRASWPASIKCCIEEKAMSSGAAALRLKTPVSVKAPRYSVPSSLKVSNFIYISRYVLRLHLMSQGRL